MPLTRSPGLATPANECTKGFRSLGLDAISL